MGISSAASKADDSFKVSEKASAAAGAVTSTVSSVDQQLGVSKLVSDGLGAANEAISDAMADSRRRSVGGEGGGEYAPVPSADAAAAQPKK